MSGGLTLCLMMMLGVVCLANPSSLTGRHSKELTEKRRKIVSELMFKRGISSPTELCRVLKSEFGISVGRNAIYVDIKALSGLRFDDEMRSFDSFVLAKMKRNYIALEDLADRARESGDVRVEADVRRKLSGVAKDFHEVSHRIFEADKRSSPRRKEVPTSFSFGKVSVVEPKSLKKPSGKTEVDSGG